MFASLYVRPWLRLAGVPVGRGAEISTVVGLSRLTSFAPGSFAADDVVLATGRARDGWLHVAPIHIGERTFLGNGALLHGGTMLGPGGLIGVLTTAPDRVAAGTSWLGSPPIELQRSPDSVDPRRTTDPPLALVIARAATEIVRIILPATVSIVLAAAVLSGLELLFRVAGTAVMVAATPLVLLAAGIVATTITIGVKWVLMGRYRAGEHPLWSWFVWRDEIINSLQDELAGSWLLGIALATPLMSVYLRAMGAKVGCDVWCDSLTITEFDMVELGAGCVVNRFACVETHLFHDRLMRIGPTKLGAGSSIGPSSAVLPDTVLGACAWVGGRSVVLRGEQLPPATRWCGAPVTRA
jgi:non-ribosomal peptide synthetase-like protein